MDSRNDTLAGGLPHSDIHGSTPARGSPWLFAACHVLHRLLVPRHPPNALLLLEIRIPRASLGTSTMHRNHPRRRVPATLRNHSCPAHNSWDPIERVRREPNHASEHPL